MHSCRKFCSYNLKAIYGIYSIYNTCVCVCVCVCACVCVRAVRKVAFSRNAWRNHLLNTIHVGGQC